MSREQELRQEIEKLDSEMDGIRAQIKPLMKKIERRSSRMKVLKKELWDLMKDHFPTLLKEPEAYAEMRDLVARRFGVAHADLAPVAPSGYFADTRQQAFRIMLESGSDIGAAAAFIREVMDLARPVTPKNSPPRWHFEVATPDNNASGIVSLVTEDRESFRLVKTIHSVERPHSESGTLEDLLLEIRKSFAMDAEQDDEDPEDYDTRSWGRR